MRRFIPILILFAPMVIGSCKSSTGPGGFIQPSTGHGVDPNGNVWMAPPPPGEGIQMAIPPFTVPDSAEVQGDFYFTFPSSVDYEIGRIEIAMNEGTHHMNCFKTPLVWPPDSGQAQKMIMRLDDGTVVTQAIRFQPEFNATIVWTSSDMMIEAQIPYLNWVLPVLKDSGKQTVVKLPANQRMIIENHYVNKTLAGGAVQTTPNGKGAVIINIWKATTANTMPTSMMVAKKMNIYIPPNTNVTFQKDCRFPGLDNVSDWPIYVLGMTGHFHSRGKSFTVDKMQDILDANGVPTGDSVFQANIYQNAAWNEPPFTSYDPPIKLNLGQYLRYTTNYVNTTGQTFLFGPHVATEEHCNLFSWFVPAYHGGQTIYDSKP